MSELSEYRKYKKILMSLGGEVFPRVIAETINQVAGLAHYQSVKNLRERFVLRNKYTEGSLRFYKANPKANWQKINAISGSVSEYMDEQEFGGWHVPKKGRKVPIATLAARGGDPRRVVRKKYAAGQLGPGEFAGKPRGLVKGIPRPYGVYARTKKNRRLIMIRNISQSRVKVTGRRWHRDAVDFRYRRDVVTQEFNRQAQAALAAIASAQ